MMYHSQPVYIGIPAHIAMKMTPAAGLKIPLATSLTANNSIFQAEVVAEILRRVRAAKRPIIIVDGGIARNRLTAEARKLVEVTGYPYFNTAMGKGRISELDPSDGGTDGGRVSNDDVVTAVKSSDCIL